MKVTKVKANQYGDCDFCPKKHTFVYRIFSERTGKSVIFCLKCLHTVYKKVWG